MLIRNSLTFKLRSALATNSNDIESLAIEVIKKNKNVVISAQYREPAGDFKQHKTYLNITNLNITNNSIMKQCDDN